jgi:hypothetical protein
MKNNCPKICEIFANSLILSRSLKVINYQSKKLFQTMEFRITLNPSQMATAAQINALLRENGILSQLLNVPTNVTRPAPVAQRAMPITQPIGLTSSFVHMEFEPGY